VVNFPPPAGKTPTELEGKFIPVRIVDATSFTLIGEPALL
jgi:hypothetical protein